MSARGKKRAKQTGRSPNRAGTTAEPVAAPAVEQPRKPFLRAEWRQLAMLNYEVEPALLAPYLPAGVDLDFYQGKTYLSIVGFLFTDVRLHGLSVPWHRHFPEVNLRFYVRRQVGREVRRGVVFIKEIAPRWAVSAIARRFYHEHYVTLPMRHELDLADGSLSEGGEVTYAWRFGGRWNQAFVRTYGLAYTAAAGSLADFITEQYFAYTRRRDGQTLEYHVTHPRWRLWRVAEAQLDCNVAALYGAQFADVLSRTPAMALLAEGSEIAMFGGQPVA